MTRCVSTSGGNAPSTAKPRASMPGLSSSKSHTVRRSSVAMYALMSTDEAATGFESAPRTEIPYSVSMPQTLRIAMPGTLPAGCRTARGLRLGDSVPVGCLEVLAGGGPLDGAAALGRPSSR